jgi:glycosyltransferase involved in cell wall biosynthesis
MRILHVITTLDVGGAEMHLMSQVRGQCARGHEVRVAYLKGQGTLVPDFEAAGAQWVGSAGTFPPLGLAGHLRWCEIVHSHLLKADLVTAVSATLRGKRKHLIASKHNDEQVLKKPLVSFIHARQAGIPARTIVLSDHVGRFFQVHGGVPPERTRRIYYGIDPTPFEAAAREREHHRRAIRAELGLADEEVVLICIARFAAQKAHDVLLRAFARARQAEAGPRLRLLLVGDDPFGDWRQRAESVARELELGSAVIFAGIRRDVPALLAASDVFVMCALWEGLGLVFLEAMAAKLPVLATRVSAVPEVVVDGESGRLVPPAEVEPLARGMVELAADSEARGRMGAAGHARVLEVFALDRMIDETLEVYREVLSAAGGGASGR